MMLARSTRLVAVTCTVGLLAGCSSDNAATSAANTTPPTATTSTAAPQATVATPTVPPTTAAVTVATVAPGTTDATTVVTGASEPTPSTTNGTTNSTTNSTVVGTTAPAGSAASGGYTKVSPPTVPATTATIRADNTHPDGVYYATVTEGGDPPPADGSVVFELVQLFVGPSCTAHFGAADEESCVNDYGVETDPTSTIEVPLTDQYITVADAATQDSLKITGRELYGLLHGDDPSAGAPADYLYSGFGFLVTIAGGTVTRLEQWWTP